MYEEENKQTLKKSNIIPIKNNNSENHQYSLKQNFFDPTKSSPPNIFMIKLYSRMYNYESSCRNAVIFDNK